MFSLSSWQASLQYIKQSLSSFYYNFEENSDLPTLSKAKLSSEFQHYQNWCEHFQKDIDLLAQNIALGELSYEKLQNILLEFQNNLDANIVSPIYYQQMLARLETNLKQDSKLKFTLKTAKHDLHQQLSNNPNLALNFFYNDVINLVIQFCTQGINEKFLFNSLNFYKKFIDATLYQQVLAAIQTLISLKNAKTYQEVETIYHTNPKLNLAYENLVQQLNQIFDSEIKSDSKAKNIEPNTFSKIFEKIKHSAIETIAYVKDHREIIATTITGAATLTAITYVTHQTATNSFLSINHSNFITSTTFMLSHAVLNTRHDYTHGHSVIMLSGVASLFSSAAAQNTEGTLSVNELNGSNGFTVLSKYANSYIGKSVHTAYDMNNDGIDDAIIGAPGCPASSAYVIEGQNGNYPATLNLTNLNGANGFEMDSPDNSPASYLSLDQCFGFSVTAGDFNKDGFSDIAVGDPAAYQSRGATYTYLGQSTFPANVNMTNLNGDNGSVLIGSSQSYNPAAVYNEQSGASVTSGDINGDGYTDLCIGAPNADLQVGKSYIYLGRKNFAPTIDLTYAQEGLITLYGNSSSPQGNFGAQIVSADFNGDSYADLAVSAPFANNSYGVITVFYGAAQLPTTINAETCSNCFHFYGYQNFQTGNLLSAVLDINGDGIADLVIAQYPVGPIYVVFGQKGGFTPGLTLQNLNGKNGYVITTPYLVGIGDAGDFNGDGYNELIIGDAMAGNWGTAFIYYGHSGSFPAKIDTSQMNATNSYRIVNDYDSYKIYGSEFGTGVNTAGDMNQDGCADVMVSNPHGYTPYSNVSSATYFVFSDCNQVEKKASETKQAKVAKLMTLGFAKKSKEQVPINEDESSQFHKMHNN